MQQYKGKTVLHEISETSFRHFNTHPYSLQDPITLSCFETGQNS